MKSKRVNRYYCEFCKKSGCSAGLIRRHEERCTMNPRRVCGVCKLMEQVQSPMSLLLEKLPKRGDYPLDNEGGIYGVPVAFLQALDTALPSLRDAAGNCPACILATLRQCGAYVPAVDGFNFTKEMKGVWSEFNMARQEDVYYG